MILRRKGPTLLCLLLLQLSRSNSQNARSYDTSDWIPIPQPCSDCKSNDHVIEKKATGRVLNLPERFLPDEYRNVRQTNNYAPYLTESGTTTKQKQRPHNKGYVQSNGQYELPQNHQLTPAQLQQAYTSQHLLPNIDLITRQVLQQSQKIAEQIRPAQALGQNQYQIAPNQYNPALVQQNLLRQQNYPAVPQQFLLPQQLQQQQAQYYQQQGFIQQPQLQNFQIAQPPKQEVQNINQTSTLYDSAGIQNLNHELLNDAGQGYRTVDITSTTPKTEKEHVQLLYVPLEHLQQKQQRNGPTTKTTLQSQKRHRHKPPTEPLKKENLLESIEQDFIQQALQAHRFQEELDQPNFYSPTSPPTTTTLKSVSRKRRPHQPPLAVYMNGAGNPKITDVLNALKDAKTIDVQDTIGPESPHVFVGPANLDPPQGFTKYELPYLSSIESNRIERKVDQLPFFVAPLNYKTPAGYSKIPFPSPHVGSVVINNNELERSRPLEAVPSVEDFLNPYQIAQSEPVAEVKQKTEGVNIKPVSDEESPVYYVRKPTKTRSRQQSRTRTPSNIVAEQTIQSGPSVNYINNYETASNKQNENNLYNTNTFPVVTSTITPNYQDNINPPNVEINNPSLNLSNQFRGQIPTNQYLTYDQNGGLQEQQSNRQKVNQNDLVPPPLVYQKENKQNLQSANLDYYSEISNVTPQTSLQTGDKHQQSSTPKYDSNFEILPSVSSTISPFNTKDGTQDFFKEFANFQAASIPSNANYYDDYNSRSNDQNQKRPIDQNVEDVFFNNKQSNNQQSANNDRRYLPLNSQVPPPQIDYEDVFQLPLSVNQVNTDQKQINIENEASSRRNIAKDENYKTLEQYPVHSTSPTSKEQVPTRQPVRQRTRGRTHDESENRAHLQQIPQENYELLPISDQQVVPEKNVKTDVNSYGNNFPVESPVENPVLPGLINSLEDPSIRQLLTPILLAPPEKLKPEIPVTIRPTQAPIAYDHYSQRVPFDINYNYDQISTTTTTTTETPSSTQSAIQFETTTQRRQRNRGRGSSRYNDRTTTSSPRRNPAKIRTQHPSRNRFRQSSTTTTTTTTQAYVPIKHPIYTTTTETVKRIPTRQKFRTRGRPLQSEFYSSTPGFKINRTPETTTPQVVIPKEEPEPKIEIQHEFYEEQPVKKPQLITRSKILTPEEEYLVNKYNLQVTTIDDPVTDNIQVLSQNVQEELPEQRLDGSKAIEVQQVYRTTSDAPIITELELTTRRVVPPKQTYLTKHNIARNQIRTEHTPVKIRTRIRARKTTQRPTTTTTTTVRNMLSSASSIEEQEQDFYGFFREPAFSTPRVETTVKTPYQGKSLYNPIIIGHPNSDLYEDEDVEINDDGVQIFTNNQYSSSTPVHFIGELLPKQVTTEKYYEATYEPLPPADRYISASTSTTTEEPKRKLRLPSRKNQQETQRINSIQQSESISRRAPQRTRTRGRSSYKLPSSVTSERSAGNDNYPELYLKAKSDNQQYDPQSAKTDSPQSKSPIQQTEKPSFQITIDSGDGEEDGEDQEPYSSILRPKVLPLASNHWLDQDKTKKDDEQITIATEPSTVGYETTTNNQEKIESTTTMKEEVSQKSKKRGYWKLVKTKKITDDFEVAESQNVGVVSLNSFGDDSKQKQSSDGFSKKVINPETSDSFTEEAINANLENEEDFVNSLYTMFGLTTVTPINETITDSSETTESSPSETPTTATPLMPEEFETTTSDNQDYLHDPISEDNSDLDDVSINEDEDWGLGVVETSTSTSTEISHETEICYKGVCVKSNEMK